MMQAYFIRSFLCLSLFATAAVQAQVTVIADGPGNTYELMDQQGYNVESPDCGHAVKHINEVMDSQLGKYVFAFTLHRDLDDDRCGATDRQRIELRGKGSEQQGTQGSTSYYRWKFKLDANFQESPNFCHIMQLKAYGNGHGSGAPIITLTPRYNNKMEIGHTGLGGAVATADLDLFKGVWAEAYVKIKHDNNGTLEFVIKRLSDGVTLLSYTNNSLDMWEDGAGYGAPKFGFYRSLNSPSYLRDETIYLADICVTKGTTNLCPSSVGTGCVPASASADDGNVPANVLDNNLTTRWSANGDGQWIQLCLSSTQTISGVKIAFYNGDVRSSNFDIQVSTNGTSFTNVATGLNSSGTSTALETFNFTAASAKWVRIVGHGNSVNAWNSYTEVQVVQQTSPPCVPASASTDDGNVPANVLDNDLNTRWSASGDPQWIQLCLSSTQTVSGVQIAFYNGNARSSNFDIQVSTNGTSFTNVATGLNSSGTSTALETFNFSPQSAKYVRIVGHGNSVNAWNSYTEIKVLNGGSFVSRVGKMEEAAPEIELTTTPNPFTQQATVSFNLKDAGQTKLAVYDINGKVVAVLVNGNLPAGKHTIPFKSAETPAGSYILQLQHGGKSVSKKLQKL